MNILLKNIATGRPKLNLPAFIDRRNTKNGYCNEETANKVTWEGSKYGCASQINAFRYNFGGKTNIPLKM